MIAEAPGQMFKATKIVPSAHFKQPFNACTVESLKISINYALEKKKPIKIDKQIQKELQANQLIQLDGWYFTQTEAELCKLAAEYSPL